MKKIDLSGDEFFKNQFLGLLEAAPNRRPFTTSDVIKAVTLHAKATQANGSLLLEEADYTFYKGIVEVQDWRVAMPQLAEFITRIIDAPDVKVSEADTN